jgi:hypothetical protein
VASWSSTPFRPYTCTDDNDNDRPQNQSETEKVHRESSHFVPRDTFGCRIRASYLSRKTSSDDVHDRRATMRVPRQVRSAIPRVPRQAVPTPIRDRVVTPRKKYPNL